MSLCLTFLAPSKPNSWLLGLETTMDRMVSDKTHNSTVTPTQVTRHPTIKHSIIGSDAVQGYTVRFSVS